MIDIGGNDYSSVFDGQWGFLDYAFVKNKAASRTRGAVWHVNADELDLFDYNTDFGRNDTIYSANVPGRFSDHDPILVGMQLRGSKAKKMKKDKKKKKKSKWKGPKRWH